MNKFSVDLLSTQQTSSQTNHSVKNKSRKSIIHSLSPLSSEGKTRTKVFLFWGKKKTFLSSSRASKKLFRNIEKEKGMKKNKPKGSGNEYRLGSRWNKEWKSLTAIIACMSVYGIFSFFFRRFARLSFLRSQTFSYFHLNTFCSWCFHWRFLEL